MVELLWKVLTGTAIIINSLFNLKRLWEVIRGSNQFKKLSTTIKESLASEVDSLKGELPVLLALFGGFRVLLTGVLTLVYGVSFLSIIYRISYGNLQVGPLFTGMALASICALGFCFSLWATLSAVNYFRQQISHKPDRAVIKAS